MSGRVIETAPSILERSDGEFLGAIMVPRTETIELHGMIGDPTNLKIGEYVLVCGRHCKYVGFHQIEPTKYGQTILPAFEEIED